MLKLAKLPDRTPIKLTITVNAGLHHDLQRYAALYRHTYGEEAAVAELVPFMLDSFLKSDPVFAKARREGLPKAGTDKPASTTSAARGSKTPKATLTTAESATPETQED
jgi:hypothetical protein